MSNVVSVLGNIHDRQFAAAAKVQSVAIKAVRQMISLTDRVFEASDDAARRLPGVAAPVMAVVGRRGELVVLLKKNARQWAELQRDYHVAIIETLLREAESAEPARPRPEAVNDEGAPKT